MRLTNLKINDFMAITALDVDLDGAPVVAFEGKNGTGKTSALRAIMALFAGGRSIPDVPIRKGAKKAVIIGETETLRCTRTFSKSGTKLEVRPTEAGAVKMSKPQAVLDALIGMFLDPLEFDRMAADRRLRVLRELAGIDLSGLEAQRADIEAERRDVGRDQRKAEGALAKLPPLAAGDGDEMTVAEILSEITARERRNDDRNSQRSRLADLREEASNLIEQRTRVSNRVDELETELREAREEIDRLTPAIEEMRAEGKLLAATVEGLPPDESVDDLRAQLTDAEAAATRAADAARRSELELEAKGHASLYSDLTDRLADIDAAKAKAVSEASYPIEGLEALDDGVYLDGVPWDQCNSSRRIVASASIGFALHPELKIVCVENASLLDQDARRLLHETAAACGGQAFLEIVSSGDGVAVVIEGEDAEDAAG